MELTKIVLNGGIELNEVKDNETIYDWRGDILVHLCKKDIFRMIAGKLCIIRDNKIIDIIQDEEYDNNKPYLIGKDENHIVGFIKCDASIYFYNAIETLDVNNNCDLNEFISFINLRGYAVYRQE